MSAVCTCRVRQVNARSHILSLSPIRSISLSLRRSKGSAGNLPTVQARKNANVSDSYPITFKSISLHEPSKAILLPYLDAESEGVPVTQRPFVPRLATVIYSLENDRELFESAVSLDTGIEVALTQAAKGQHSPFDRDSQKEAPELILSHPEVQDKIKSLHLPTDAVVQVDTWPCGSDKFSNEETPNYIQGLLYARTPNNHPDSNQYAFPLPFSPVLVRFQKKIVRIDPLATGGEEDRLKYGTAPEDAPMAHCVENEYHPDLIKVPIRKDLKPLQVVQPLGPSFRVSDENLVEWQKWRFRFVSITAKA
ncbi:hypothetical protein MAP00_009078 [Monascus purpureus]|nr:hypothetical protein MAP00_009078 [Monascus purpureus]